MDIEECAEKIASRAGLFLKYKLLQVQIHSESQGYKFKNVLPDNSPRSFGPEAYIFGQLHPIPNMSGTHVIGTAHAGIAFPLVGTLGCITILIMAIASPEDHGFIVNLLCFSLLTILMWMLVILAHPHIDLLKTFEANLKAFEPKPPKLQKQSMKPKRDAQQSEHPSKARSRKRH